MGKIRLRTRFLLSLLALSTGLTSAMLLVVRYRVEKQVREAIREDLHNSVRNYESFERLREATLTHTAMLVADMPNLRALMTTQKKATIQDESKEIWQLSGSDLFVLTSTRGDVLAFQSSSAGFAVDAARDSLRASLARGNVWDWWFSGGRLYQIWLQPVYSGDQSNATLLGFLAIGQEVDESQARNFSNVASSEAVFRYGSEIAASTLSAEANGLLQQQFREGKGNRLGTEQEIQIGSERYLGTTVRLSYGPGTPVSLSVLKSFDRATTFLKQLNRVLLILGFVSVLAGTVLAFLLSKTITRPLARLVTGLHAFEKGDSSFPLDASGGDEVAEVTAAFDRLRANLQKTENEQKQLEQRLRQAHKMEAVGRLAGGIAHDFNNILMIVRGYAEILLERLHPEDPLRGQAAQIMKAGNRAAELTQRLLGFSRKQVFEPKILNVNDVVSEISKMLPTLLGAHVDFSLELSADAGNVNADPIQMEQVLINLAVNSRDAMPQGGKLIISTAARDLEGDTSGEQPAVLPGRYAEICVQDSGCGIDKETVRHIFEPFFTTKDKDKGTGLGLSTVYGIVKRSGGYILVSSEAGIGTTMRIYLPLVEREVESRTPDVKANGETRGTGTVLIAEDEQALRELVAARMRAEGYEVLEAENGEEAVRAAQEVFARSRRGVAELAGA